MQTKKMKAPAWAGGLKRARVSAVLALAALWGSQAHAVAPTVSITSPTSSFSATGPALVSIRANAADSDGRVVSVEFYNGATLLGRTTTGATDANVPGATYSYSWQNVAAGTYSITAKATDDTGAVTTSPVVQFAINGAPSVSMTSPSSGAMYTAPAAVTLTAEASDRDGNISKVAFYNGTLLLGTVTSGTAVGTSTAIKSYSYNWSNVAAGSYGITARAYDNKGAVSASTVQFTVNAVPTVSLTAPVVNASYTAPASIAITANAGDGDGSIAKVEFYNGTALLGTVTSGVGDANLPAGVAKYQFNWTNVAAGSYSLTAKAYDNRGAVTTSGRVAVTVAASNAPTVSLTSPAANASYTAPATVNLAANASNPDGTAVAKVEFYSGTTLLNSDTTAPYSYSWTNVAAGSYSITAKAYNSAGVNTTSTAVAITVKAANAAPTVSLTAPAANASYTAPASVTITANAADSDGTISKVEFYNGATLLGTVTSGVGDANLPAGVAKYQFNWTNVAAGSYSLTAKAYDNRGAVTTSGRVAVTVAASTAPTVSLTSPAANASYTAPATVSLAANASNPDGKAVAKVEFYSGTTLLNSDTTAPYSYSWANVAAGSYSITAKAYNSTGVNTTSTAVAITVKAANVAPTVSLTAPAANASYTAPASVTITANAADSDGTISKVEFYNGATLLNSDAAAPYSYSWANVAAGSYSITAKAYDNAGAITTSAAVAITVKAAGNAAPTVSLTAPAANASYTAPASVTITANAADSDGTISKVEFYNGATLLNSDTTAPYSYSWANVAAGSYSITAKAYDNAGAITTSAAVAITVSPAPVAATTLYFVHPDHLGTPRMITDSAKKVVWRWDNAEAFGSTGLQEDPDGDTKKFTFNLRFAGQYYDLESGLHYNRNRDYDPATGRYVQADPIGLNGGISLYGYVSGNPLSFIDPLGLAKCDSTRRTQTQGDVTVPSERAARREAMRQHGGSTSQANNYKRIENPDKNVNLRGPRNEKAEFLEFENSKGETVKVDHHKWGHEFKDNGTFEKSHYHGPKGNHISYD